MAFSDGERWQIHDEAGRRKYLTQDEFARFLSAARRLSPPMLALCHLIAYSGCRVSEALALTVQQLDMDRLAITFRTLKRRRPVFRIVPIPADTAQLILNLPHEADGRLWAVHRVTAWRTVKATMIRAGIAGPMSSPKGLRHCFGMRAAGHNVPISMIQKWMGHASPVTTSIYLDAVGIEERKFASRTW